MRNRAARETVETAQTAAVAKNRGLLPSAQPLSAQRITDILIPDLSKLPAVENNVKLQNDAGAFIFLTGYSALGGGDVLA